jgi:hypothetical protein
MNQTQEIANIGLGQRRFRLIAGAVAGVAAVALAAALIALRVNPLWRLAVYFPLVITTAGYFESRSKTCVALAMAGQCSLEDHMRVSRALRGDKIQDPALAARLRRRANGLLLKIHGTAILLAVLAWLLPL